ncbi:unnamed protein product, partial [Tetraodon nigroviridis]
SRNMRAAKDMQNYRRGYPNLTDDECSEDKMNNLQFYLNKYPSAPDDVYIESFLKEWKNDYKRLERVHSYIQWLFPLREPGVNYMASELTKKEIEAFKNNEDAKKRLVESYELMLGFYGIRLVNKATGEVKRADNWKERFGNLERNMHNNLRITRILKSLGELGFRHYQAPLVRFFLEETLEDPEAVQEGGEEQGRRSRGGGRGSSVPGAEGGAGETDEQRAEAKPPGAESLRNGIPEAESGNEMSVNGESVPEEADDMEQSLSPDTASAARPGAAREAELGDASKEPDNMLTDGDEEAEKPPKKKREDVPKSNGSAGEPAEGRGGSRESRRSGGLLRPNPPKDPENTPRLPFWGGRRKSPGPISAKGTDGDASPAHASAPNGSARSAHGGAGERADGKEPEDVDMESQTSVANAQSS